jgi:hypothetical protein
MSVVVTSCSIPHFYYSSNSQSVPLFNEKNEFYGLFAGSFGAVNQSIELQAGYAFPGHIALMGNFMTGGNDNSSVNYSDFSKIHYLEGAGGYYTSFGKLGVFEIYGGYGHGSEHHAFTYVEYDGLLSWITVPDGRADLSFSKIFIQPDIGIKIKWMESAFSFRISNVDFTGVDAYSTTYHLQELDNIRLNHTSWLFEPAFTFRAGFEPVKFQIQMVFSGNLSNPDQSFEIFRVNFGLSFNLSKKQFDKSSAETTTVIPK